MNGLARVGTRLGLPAGAAAYGPTGPGGDRGLAPRRAPEPYPVDAWRGQVRPPRKAMPRYEEQFLSDTRLLAAHRWLASLAKGLSAEDTPQSR